jgi:glycosyltransferase involved in cell wall biosynthesis
MSHEHGPIGNPAMTDVLKSVHSFVQLKKHSPEKVMDLHGDSIRGNLSRESENIVLVCALNEAANIPYLFFALAQNSIPLKPILIDNGSSDQTAEFATALGATVISESRKGKIFAELAGFRYITECQPDTQAIFHTDADSYPLSTWAQSVLTYTEKNIPKELGGQVFSPLVYFGSFLRDTFRSAVANTIDRLYERKGFARAHGPNTLIIPDQEKKILHSLVKPIDAVPVIGVDAFLADRVREAGGRSSQSFSIASTVLTDGDRYASVMDIVRTFRDPDYKKILYADWFAENPSGVPYRPASSPSVGKYKN